MHENQQVLSDVVLEALASIDPRQPFSSDVYAAIARLVPSIAVEAVALRNNNGDIEVLLTQRAKDDPAYPGQWHCPGSILRSGEEYFDVMERLQTREFGVNIKGWGYVDEIFFQEERGWFNNRIFLVQLNGKPTQGKWFSTKALPVDIVAHHREHVIPKGVEFFLTHANKHY